MDFVAFAPFGVVLLVGAVAGAFLPGRLAWWIALFVPVAHLALSIVTGRAREDFLDYVLPVNVLLLGIAIIGLLSGRWLRGRHLEP